MSRISDAQYAKALLDSLEGNGEEKRENILSSFVAAIKKNGDWARRGKILLRAEDEMRRREGKSLVRVEMARPLADAQKEKIRALFRQEKTDFAWETHAPLIAGVRMTVDDSFQFDATLAKMLTRIFR